MALHDPGGKEILAELKGVGVHGKHALRSVLEHKREGIQRFGSSKPGELGPTSIGVGLKVRAVLLAHAAVDAVAGDDQIRVPHLG